MHPGRLAAVLSFVVVLSFSALAQDYAQFNVFLDLNYASAEQTVELFGGLSGHPDEVAQLRGSQIALATTAYLAQRPLTLADLERSLESAKFNQSQGDDPFRMGEARSNVAQIKELLGALRQRNFGQKVVSTVEQLFPPNARVNTRIPVYLVAFGHQNIDAYVQRIVWRGNTPTFLGEGQGELTIVVNLDKAVGYGPDLDERFIWLMSVVAHEVFHAAFGAYKDDSPVWRQYYAKPRTYLDALLDLAQNEGIAYYLTLIQRTRGRLVMDWPERVRAAFTDFNRNAEELLSPRTPVRRAEELIRTANTSEYWQNYGAITGMIIARQIDNTFGRAALSETVANGVSDFFLKYVEVMKQQSDYPRLSPVLLQYIQQRR
ncbi:MAG: hypothetical protein H6Q32_533 [Bacteroidetes bacterium]|nr:hypothetical protein [Bacteroidota bacterium]